MNSCGCTNYFMTGYMDLAAPILWAIEQAAIAAELAGMRVEQMGDYATVMGPSPPWTPAKKRPPAVEAELLGLEP